MVLLSNGMVLVGDPRDGQVVPIDVRIDNGVIAELGENLPARPDEFVHDVRGRWVLPGFVDAYQRSWHAVVRGGLVDCDASRARQALAAAFARLEPDDVRWAALGSGLAQIEAGTTCTADHFDVSAGPEVAHAALDGFLNAGLRGWWVTGGENVDRSFADCATEVADRSGGRVAFALGVDRDDGAAAMMRLRDANEAYVSTLGYAGQTSHSPEAASIADLVAAGLVSSSQVHTSCTTTPIEDMSAASSVGAGFVFTPEVDMAWGLGYPPVKAALDAGLRVGLGSGSASVVGPDMFGVMRMGLESERGRYQQEAAERSGTSGIPGIALRCADVLHAATLGGAQALGLGDRCGSIEVGKAADLLVARVDGPRMTPAVDPVVAIVLHLTVAEVSDVLIDGVYRKRDGQLVRDDLPEVLVALAQGAAASSSVADHDSNVKGESV